MTDPPDCCREFAQASTTSRRRFLAAMAATAGAVATTSVFGEAFRQTAFAADAAGTANNVLVVLSLRGGIDGIGVVVPHGDPGYYKARPNLGVPKSVLLAPDPMFGLHPKMAPLRWLWDAGQLAVVQAVGMSVPNRSHFSAMEDVEDANPGSSVRQGWINRMISLDTVNEPYEAVQLGTCIVPTELYGSAPALAADRLNQVALVGAEPRYDGPPWFGRRRAQLDRVWTGPSTVPLRNAYRSAIKTVDALARPASAAYTPGGGAVYPTSDLANALKDSAQLIKADVGAEVVAIDCGSWDMHADYGDLGGGRMQYMVDQLAAAVNAFMRDLGPLRSRVTLVTISEFGRRTRENGNRGLDHGWGNMMLLAGAGVKGGKYYGSWPGLGTGTDTDGDLKVTTDYRNVFGEILATRFPDRSLGQVFPGLTYRPLSIMS